MADNTNVFSVWPFNGVVKMFPEKKQTKKKTTTFVVTNYTFSIENLKKNHLVKTIH